MKNGDRQDVCVAWLDLGIDMVVALTLKCSSIPYFMNITLIGSIG
jgi:hypothetical protein